MGLLEALIANESISRSLIVYLTIKDLLSLMTVSKDVRSVVKSAIKPIKLYKSPPMLGRAATGGYQNPTDWARKMVSQERRMAGCSEFLSTYMPNIDFGPRKRGLLLEDYIRALVNNRKFEFAFSSIMEFQNFSHLSLDVMEENENFIVRGAYRILQHFPQMLSVELYGADAMSVRAVKILELTEFTRNSAPPKPGCFLIYLSEKLDLTKEETIRNKFRQHGRGYDGRSAVEFFGDQVERLEIMLATKERRRTALWQCASSNMRAKKLYYGSDKPVDNTDRFVAEVLEITQDLDPALLDEQFSEVLYGMIADGGTVEEMLCLPVIRLLERGETWNPYYRAFLIPFILQPELPREQRLEFVQDFGRGEPIKVLFYSESPFETRIFPRPAPPFGETYYQPLYAHKELTRRDTDALWGLESLEKIIIMENLALTGQDVLQKCAESPIIQKMFETVSNVLAAGGRQLIELNIQHHRFRSSLDGEESFVSYAEDSEEFRFVWKHFPYLRLVSNGHSCHMPLEMLFGQ